MYKLKIKRMHQASITTKYFNSTKEVAEYLAGYLNIKNIEQFTREQKETHLQIYLSYKKDN